MFSYEYLPLALGKLCNQLLNCLVNIRQTAQH
jgi:hypothetical protein